MPDEIKKAFEKTNWKHWRFGLRFAIGMAVAQMLMNIGMVSKASWNDIIVYICTTIGGAAFGYMQKHPIETISTDTVIIKKEDVK